MPTYLLPNSAFFYRVDSTNRPYDRLYWARHWAQQSSQKDWHHPASPTIALPSDKIRLSEDDFEHESDADVLVAEPELAKPPMYAVVMYNDNYTPMDFVVYVLQSEFRHSIDEAVEIMLNIHNNGKGIAGIFPKDIAETKAQKTNHLAQKEGYPLLTQIEPYYDSE